MTSTWSPSHSYAWRTCRRQFLLEKELGAKPAQFDAVRVIRGRIMHAGMEGAFRSASVAEHRGALSMAWYISEAHEAMRAHPQAGDLTVSEFDECRRLVSATLAVLDVPQPGSILGVEYPFSLTVNGVPLRGVIDFAYRTGPRSLTLTDWKSGKVSEDPTLLESNTQCGIYSIAAPLIWSWASEVTVELFSITHGTSVSVVIPRDMQALTVGRVVKEYTDARELRKKLTMGNVDRLYPARTGDHCTSCLFRSYCPKFAEAKPPIRPGIDVAAERDRLTARMALSP